MNFLTIDYEEFNKNSYKSLDLQIDGKIIKFNTGDPIIDYYEYCLFFEENKSIQSIAYSSSIDNFLCDTNYTWRYINPDTGEFATDEEKQSWTFDEDCEACENGDECSSCNSIDKYYSVMCSNRIKTRNGYNKHIRNWYKLHPKHE